MTEDKIKAKEDQILDLQGRQVEYVKAWRQALHTTAVLSEQIATLTATLKSLTELRDQAFKATKDWQDARVETADAIYAAQCVLEGLQSTLDNRDGRELTATLRSFFHDRGRG